MYGKNSRFRVFSPVASVPASRWCRRSLKEADEPYRTILGVSGALIAECGRPPDAIHPKGEEKLHQWQGFGGESDTALSRAANCLQTYRLFLKELMYLTCINHGLSNSEKSIDRKTSPVFVSKTMIPVRDPTTSVFFSSSS